MYVMFAFRRCGVSIPSAQELYKKFCQCEEFKFNLCLQILFKFIEMVTLNEGRNSAKIKPAKKHGTQVPNRTQIPLSNSADF
jgi:hypothetical protein